MEKLLDLKMPGVTALDREELTHLDGGMFEELIPLYVRIAIAIDEFMQGVVDGYKRHNY